MSAAQAFLFVLSSVATFPRQVRARGLVLALLMLLPCASVFGQAYNWKPVAIKGGGFVTGIIPHPNAPGVMYCRTDIGGAYRWNPANDSWVPLLDFVMYTNGDFSLNGVESIAIDPSNSNRVYMACGWLGSGYPNALLVSTNQGATFIRSAPPFVMGANNDGRSNGERLKVDPNTNNILFFGSRYAGLWKSINYGANWSQVTSFPVTTTANSVGLVFVEFLKSSGSPGSATPTIFVGVSQPGTNIFRSTDGGTTWTNITPSGLSSTQMPHRAAQDGLTNMYITFSDGPGPNSISAGSVWKLNLSTLAVSSVTPPTGGGGGFAGVSVDKQNPSNVVVSTIDRWSTGDEVYRSTNGGSSWRALYSGATVDVSSAPWVAWHGTAGRTHWVGDVEMDPFNSNRLYHVSGGGVYSCYNVTAANSGGNVTFQFRSDGIEECGLSGSGGGAFCSPPSGSLLLDALGDIGGFTHYNLDSSPPDTNFYNPIYNSNMGVDYAEANPNIVVRTFWTSPYGSYSTNAGRTWRDFTSSLAGATNYGPGKICVSADGSRFLWAPEGSPAYYSTNRGTNWTLCSGSPTPPNTWDQLIVVADRVNTNKFYLYMPSPGRMYVSTDGGASFSAGGTLGSWCEGARTVFGYEGHIWMAGDDQWTSGNNGLWCSINSGTSFTKFSNVQAAHAVGLGRAATGQSYPAIYIHGNVGNVWGVFRSDNQGTNWVQINDAQHQYGWIAEVTGDQRTYGRCYIGTSGRGILYGDIPVTAAPTGLVATAVSTAEIDLRWTDNATNETGFKIQRKTGAGGTYGQIATVGTGVTNYSNINLASGTQYYYQVCATNAGGDSPFSNETNATTMFNTPPILPAISNYTINVGVTLTFTNTATDTDQPPQTFTFSLPSAPTNATLVTNAAAAVFSWRPLVTQADTTNLISLMVADNGTPSLSATQSFTVTVNPLTQPTAASIVLNNGQMEFQVSGQAGPDYAVQVSSNLFDWNTLFITNSPAMPFSWTDTNQATLPAQFYRIKVGPPLP